jgi:hypothetical protein
VTDLDKLVAKMEYKNKYIASLEIAILNMLMEAEFNDDVAGSWAGHINAADDNAILRILFQNSDWQKTERVSRDMSVGECGGWSNAECSTAWASAIMEYLNSRKIDKLVEWACEADE